MQPNDKTRVLADLQHGREILLDVLSDVTEIAARRVPAPGKWSVLECVEHLAVSESYLLSQIMSARQSDVSTVNKEREAQIFTVGLDRTRTVPCPDVALPTGRFSTLEEALQHFLATRTRTIQFVESCDGDLRSKLISHPVFGPVNGYETLLMMAVHPRRHAKQVEEIKNAIRQ
jgi:hypothetical protein